MLWSVSPTSPPLLHSPPKKSIHTPWKLSEPRQTSTAWHLLRYDLSKLRAKGLTLKVAKSRRHRLTTEGYSVCLVFLKLLERI